MRLKCMSSLYIYVSQFVCTGAGWGGAGSRHKGYVQWGGGWQDVCKDPLRSSKYIVSLTHGTLKPWAGKSTIRHSHMSRWNSVFFLFKLKLQVISAYNHPSILDFPLSFFSSSFPSFLLHTHPYFCSLALTSCCGAGTAADTTKTTDLLSSNLTIFSLNSGRRPRVIMAVNILQDMLYRFVLHTYTCSFGKPP